MNSGVHFLYELSRPLRSSGTGLLPVPGISTKGEKQHNIFMHHVPCNPGNIQVYTFMLPLPFIVVLDSFLCLYSHILMFLNAPTSFINHSAAWKTSLILLVNVLHRGAWGFMLHVTLIPQTRHLGDQSRNRLVSCFMKLAGYPGLN